MRATAIPGSETTGGVLDNLVDDVEDGVDDVGNGIKDMTGESGNTNETSNTATTEATH